jgi:hypothetical protein
MWGGYTCPVCGSDVDKWGREVAKQGKLQDNSTNFWTKKRNIGFDRLRDAPAGVWVFVALLLALDIWWDLRNPGGFIIDAILLPVFLVRYRRYRQQRDHKSG